MLISRFMGKKKKVEGEDALKVLEFNPVINKLLEKVLDFERFLISLGISFPFGGSLFLIATKKIRI